MTESWENNWEDYYQILGVPSDAGADEIKETFLYKNRILHPDSTVGKPESIRRRAEEELKKINYVYDVLKDPDKRRKYHEEWLRRNARSNNSNSYRNSDASGDRPKSPPPKSEYSAAPKPRPVVTPNLIRSDNADINETYSSSFIIENAGGAYSKLAFTRPNSWLKVVRWTSLSASDELPMKVEIEAVGMEWGRTYNESIKVNLDSEETTVQVELTTKPFPANLPDSGRKGNSKSTSSKGKWFAWLSVIAVIVVIIIVIANNNKPAPGYSNYTYGQTTTQTTTTYTTIAVTYAAAPIQYGQQVAGTIQNSNGQDWKFTGQAGDIITMSMVQNGAATLKPDMDLRDPSGNVAANGDGWGNAPRPIVNYVLQHSGTYIIHVYGNSGTTGGYMLTLSLKPTGSITYGQAVAGTIAVAGDFKDWKFSGQAGDIITIHIVQYGSASLEPNILLLDSSGIQISSGDLQYPYQDTWIKNYKLASSGTYTIRAVGYYSTTGGYTLNLDLKAPTGSMTYGQSVTGQIEFSGDYENWKFSGQAGDIITIHIIQNGSASLEPNIQLFDSSGTQISSGDLQYPYKDTSIKSFKLTFSGTYTIRAVGYYNTIGSFQLTLTKN
jgi:curved DNA-binding protein CbpA